jgi:glycosyltransferase involved in cell wall biosynthesis
VHQLITGLPELRFSLVFIGGRRADYGEARYELPENVVHIDRFYLEDAFAPGKPGPARAPAARFADAHALHELLKLEASGQSCPRSQRFPLEAASDRALERLETEHGLTIDDFLSSPASWDQIRNTHRERDPHAAFVDYFWTVRLMHGPLFQLARIERQLPDAGVFHAISTGYAGFLGCLLQRRRHRPLLLSEHGIYTKERRIDLNQADWFETLHADATGSDIGTSVGLRELWIRHFESLGRFTYRSANPIISLYAGNRERQVRDGADPERTRLIVNGIDCARFAKARAARPAQVPQVIGLIGRVVPIKDVKTFIRAMHKVIVKLPEVEGWVIGSPEEDPRYGAECEALAASLGLANKVRFLGHQNVQELLPKLGLLMLTSISEAQPLAILEAFAAGVPCVATDVGACREEIEGGTAEDRTLGKAGRIAPFADAEALAAAAVELLSSPEAWQACQAAGIARVERFYTQERMLGAYRGLYRKLLQR